MLDAKTYAEVAGDQGASRMAGWIALWAAASCGIGLFGFNIFGVLECVLFAGVCLVVTTYIAFAQPTDQGSRTLQGRHQARRRSRAQGPDHPLVGGLCEGNIRRHDEANPDKQNALQHTRNVEAK